MNIQTLAMGLVGLLVAVLVVGLVAVPVIQDSQLGTPYEGTNTQVDTWDYQEESPSFTLVRSGSTITTTIDGVTETRTFTSGYEFPVVGGGIMVRIVPAGTMVINTATSTAYQSNSPDTVDITIACVDGTVTVTDTKESDPLNVSFSVAGPVLVKFTKGEWGSYTGAFKATLGQTVYFGHGPFDSSNKGPARLYSSVDGATPTEVVAAFTVSGSTVTSATVEQSVTYEEIGGLQAVGYYTGASTVYDGTTFASTFWAPLDFASTSTAEQDTNTVLLGLIPVLLFITAIMIAVRLVRDA